MNKAAMERYQETLARIVKERIIAVLRLDLPVEHTLAIADAIIASGIGIIEVTLTTPGAIEVIRQLADRPGIVVGAGTVLDESSALRTFDAGASFYASPVTEPPLIALAAGAGIVSMPGALTPTEILGAWRAGADLVKIFPMPSDGARFLSAILGPLGEVRLAPSGGINAETAPPFLRAGAAALNVGTWLTHEPDGTLSSEQEIVRRGVALCDAVASVPVGR